MFRKMGGMVCAAEGVLEKGGRWVEEVDRVLGVALVEVSGWEVVEECGTRGV